MLLGKVRENNFVDLDHERNQDCFLQIIPNSDHCSPFIWHEASQMGVFVWTGIFFFPENMFLFELDEI